MAPSNVELLERAFAATQGVDVAPVIRAVLEASPGAVPSQLPSGLAEMADLFHPEVEIDPGAVPGFSALHGMAGMLEFWTRWMEEWEHFSWVHTNLEAVGDHVVADTTLRATGKTSGAEVVSNHCQAFGFRDGRIVRWVTFEDRASALAAIQSG